MSRAFFAKSLVVCLLLLLLPSGCHEQRVRLFHPLGLTHGDGPIKRNQDLVVRFSKPLATDLVPRRAVIVRDASGRQLETRTTTRGHHLVIAPRDPLGWPVTDRLSLRINAAVAGRGLTSLSGEPNTLALDETVVVDPVYRRLPGVLELVYSDPPDGARDISLAPDPRNPFVVRLAFNAPVARESLATGIQVLDADRRRPLTDLEGNPSVALALDPHDPRQVAIHPFSNPNGLFNGGTQYEVRLTGDLRSIDGRRLVRSDSIFFRTRSGEAGAVVVDFAEPGTIADGSPLRADEDGVLRPRPLENAVTLGGAPNGTTAALFGRSQSQAQVLIPGDDLRSMGLPDGGFRFLISGVTFDLAAALPHACEVDGLVVTLDYLPFEREKEGGLSEVFSANEEGSGRGTLGPRVMALREDPTRLVVPAGSEVLALEFEEPFAYDGSGRSLVLGIQVPYGVTSPAGPMVVPVRGRAPEGTTPAAEQRQLLVSRGGRTRLSGFRPRLTVRSIHFPAAETRWFLVSDGVDVPRYFRVPNADLQARGLEAYDFDLFFQGGVPAGGPGEPLRIQETGDWSVIPQSLDRSAAFRMRIQFRPRLRGQDEPPPEIHKIVMRYKEL